jgi:hypothetical protein
MPQSFLWGGIAEKDVFHILLSEVVTKGDLQD